MYADEVGTNHPIGFKGIWIDHFAFIQINVDVEKKSRKSYNGFYIYLIFILLRLILYY